MPFQARPASARAGLLHHFPNKNTLLEALFDSLIERLDRAIEEAMRADPLPHGRFTRGYLRACPRFAINRRKRRIGRR